MSDEKLFSEFPPVSVEQWEQKILEDLKGADYEKKLIWKTIEGINVKPYYTSENLETLNYLDSAAGEFPFVRGYNDKDNNWEVRQDIIEPDLEIANKLAVDAIKNGVDSVGLRAKRAGINKDISTLLKDIDLTKTSINFIASKSYPLLLDLFEHELSAQNVDGNLVKGSFNFDPISYLLLHGNFYISQENNFTEAASFIQKVNKKLPHFKAITINGHYLHNSGASAVEELAFSLAAANEYIAQLTDKGLTIDEIAGKLMFSFAVGSNYFIEIAKLRAARFLFTNIIEQYTEHTAQSTPYSLLPTPYKIHIHCFTSTYNKSLYDSHNNLLRCTTEAMSAAIGGADSITVHPFDMIYRKPDEHSYRTARNIQLILKAESYIDKVIDPSAGSYYIENLTDSLANAAWDLFKEVEAKGGYINAIKQNFVQNRIEETVRKRNELISSGKQTILGTNRYPDLNEIVSDKLDNEYIRKWGIKELNKTIKTLNLHRYANRFEEIRLATEQFVNKGNKRPSVFLFTIGNITIRRARAGFSINFFGSAGYEIIDNNGFCSVNEGIEAAIKIKPDIVVICSSDDEYQTYAPEITIKIKAFNKNTIVIIAGNTDVLNSELLTPNSELIDDFINIKTNLLESLNKYQRLLKVKNDFPNF